MSDLILSFFYALFLTAGLLVAKYWMTFLVTGIAVIGYFYFKHLRKEEDSAKRALILWGKLMIGGIIMLWIIYHDQMKM